MEQQRRAILLALLAVLLWSTAGTAFKLSLRYVDPLQLLFGAALVSVMIFSLFITLKGKWKEIAATPLKGIGHSAILGFLNPFGYYAVLLYAYDKIRAQEAVILNYTWPVVLVLLSIPMLRQKIGPRSLAAIILSFTGSIVVITHGDFSGIHFENLGGSLLALGSAFIWASFWIQNVRDSRSELNKMFFNFLFGLLYAGLACYSFSEISIPPLRGLAGISYIGLFEMGITFLIWMQALQLADTTARVSNLIFISPFLSILLIHFIVGEALLLSSVTGLLLIIGGIGLQNMDRLRKHKDR